MSTNKDERTEPRRPILRQAFWQVCLFRLNSVLYSQNLPLFPILFFDFNLFHSFVTGQPIPDLTKYSEMGLSSPSFQYLKTLNFLP